MRRVRNMMKNIRNWPAYLAFKTFTSREKGFIFKCNNNLDIHVPKRLLHPFKESFFDETYFKGLPGNFSFDNKEELTMVDIGANVGYFSIFFLSKYPNSNVYAFEPIPKNYNLLTEYKDNLHLPGLNVFNKAVSTDEEELKLYFDASDSFTTEAGLNANYVTGTDSVTVSTISMDRIWDDNQLSRIDFLKVDCEGSEYPILYNLDEKIYDATSVIVIETHKAPGENENQDSLARFISDRGFQIRTDKLGMIWAWKNKGLQE